ncbi:MAG TPA: SpoIID/LytB domain-containing protein, partial [Candidatus Bathyarchaeia archaeon]|nr:SpoIID/LytB domain-containing protein [Candidatus Bathyarchaeia archaeon]
MKRFEEWHMRIFDRRLLAALFFCLLFSASCGEKRAVMQKPPVETSPAAETPPAVAPPAAPREEPRAGQGEKPAEKPRPLPEAPRVRVLVLGAAQTARVRIPSGSTIGVDTNGEPLGRIERGGDFAVKVAGGEAVLAAGRKRLISSGSIYVKPGAEGFVSVSGKAYRGIMLFKAVEGGVAAVNILDIDDYIKGVLPSEIGRLCPEQFEAYRAQAIAARAYALAKLDERKGELYDLNATVMDQVYSGAGVECDAASQAVESTRGLVATFLGEPLRAYYCACCGGHTADVRLVWPWKTPYPYLYGVRDTVQETPGESLCRGSKHFRWRVHWSGSELAGILRRTIPQELKVQGRTVGKLSDLRVTGTGPDGRAVGVEIVTDRGTFEIQGDRIRWVMKPDPDSDAILKSTLFKIDVSIAGGRISAIDMLGGGNGHGVGMCQA